MLGLFFLSAGFGLGVWSSSPTAPPAAAELANTVANIRTRDQSGWTTFQRVWNEVHATYLRRSVKDQTLVDGATKGLVEALGDPYSVYLTKSESQDFQAEIEGSFEGVGMEISVKNNVLTIIAPLPGSPAEQAGVKPGDVITAIGDQDASAMSLDQAVQKIRGQAGTQVTITVARGDQSLDLTMTRDTIKVDSVQSHVETVGDTKLGYIQISQFSSDTAKLFQQAVQNLLGQSVSGLILDLRNDPGGLLDQAVAVGKKFIPSGPIVKEVDRNGKITTLDADNTATLTKIPTVVLINGGSASAAEILAGALQDYGQATIIGETSFGKGTVQDFQTLPDGSSLKLTVAEWQTPHGRSIQDNGITPDIAVKNSDDPQATDAQLDRAKQELTQ